MTQDQRDLSADAVAVAWVAVLGAVQLSGRAPLSARHALHAAVLLDQMSDLAFARRDVLPMTALNTADDFLAFRAAMRALDPAFGPIMDLCAGRADGPRLAVVATEVAPDGFSGLAVADLMVSLYNEGQVPRLFLVQRDGAMLAMHHLLAAATDWWATHLRV